MTNSKSPAKLTITLRPTDEVWWPVLKALAEEHNRAPGHIARQLIVASMFQMGALPRRGEQEQRAA